MAGRESGKDGTIASVLLVLFCGSSAAQGCAWRRRTRFVADINRMIRGDDEDDEDDEDDRESEAELDEAGAAPSTIGCNGMSRPTEAGLRPSPNGNFSRAGKQAQPAGSGPKEFAAPTPQRRPLNGTERPRPKKHGGAPSTNGDPPAQRRGGDDRSDDGRRRCA
jgi:hypothetical protein